MELYGRRTLWSDFDVTDDNVCAVVSQAYMKHLINREEIRYLFDYYKGKQEIRNKEKKIREDINHKITENRANQIVAFKVGYTIGKPIQYIASVSDETVSNAMTKLNDLMRSEGKITKDRKLVEWQMICGTGYRLVLPSKKGGRIPFELYTLNPMNTFVIYKNDYTEAPVAAVSYSVDEHQNVHSTVYTESTIYSLDGTFEMKIVGKERNLINRIPIIEYPANGAKLGAFEVVLPLLDALNDLDSNRMDSVQQFVESLLVLYNCDLEEDETAEDIREAGMILLHSTTDNKADVKVISETLDQTNTETLKSSMLQAINEIVGLPSQSNGSSSDSSNNGAIVLKNGWQGAETRAEDFEAIFRESEQRTLELVSIICERLSDLAFDPTDVDVKFTRRAFEDILSKSQTLVTLLNAPYVHPKSAYEASGLFTDTEEAVQMGIEWNEEKERKAVEIMERQTSVNEEEDDEEQERTV